MRQSEVLRLPPLALARGFFFPAAVLVVLADDLLDFTEVGGLSGFADFFVGFADFDVFDESNSRASSSVIFAGSIEAGIVALTLPCFT